MNDNRKDANDTDKRPTLVDRAGVLITGIVTGILLALCYSFTDVPEDFSFGMRMKLSTLIMAGPILATVSGIADIQRSLYLGWLGAPMIVANTIKPNRITFFVAVAGFVLWYWSGFLTALQLVWVK